MTKITIPLELEIEENAHTYPIKENYWDNWFAFSPLAYQILVEKLRKEKTEVESMAIIGISNGIEGILARLFLRDLEEITGIDIEKKVLRIGKRNMNKYINEIDIIVEQGSLCKSLIDAGVTHELIVANIPLIPYGSDLKEDYQKASKYDANTIYSPQKWIRNNFLESYHVLLTQAIEVLNDKGSVMFKIGGRITYDKIEKMIRLSGYTPQHILTGFKLQTEPWEVLPEFAAAEKDGVEFSFYRYEEAIARLKTEGLDTPSIISDPESLRAKLEPFRITAKEAHELYKQNKDYQIGHIVHVVRAKKN
jgi:hypothetical protein